MRWSRTGRRSCNWLLRRSRSSHWRCSRSSGRRSHNRRRRRRNWSRGRSTHHGGRRGCRCGRHRRPLHHGLRYDRLRRDGSGRNHRCRRCRRLRNLRDRRSDCRLCGNRRNRRTHRRGRRGSSFLLLRDGAQHITRTGDVRQVNLGFDFVFAAQWARGFRRRSLRFGLASDMGPDLVCFVVFDRTGVSLLLGHPDERKRVKNGLAFDFQFSREIVNSNLTHPTFLFPALGLHRSPHGVNLAHPQHPELACAGHGYSVFS